MVFLLKIANFSFNLKKIYPVKHPQYNFMRECNNQSLLNFINSMASKKNDILISVQTTENRKQKNGR